MASRGRILIIDDDAQARIALATELRERGYCTETAADGFKALHKIEQHRPDVVLTDLRLPGMDGIELMEKGRAVIASCVYVVMTSEGTIASAVRAVQRGALHYLTKPIDPVVLTTVLDEAMQAARARQVRLAANVAGDSVPGDVLGEHPSVRELRKDIALIAPSRASVLIEGDSGTGKELIAAAIHRSSSRASGPFVRLSCAALTQSLFESEIFGHEKGAFTGALQRREGRFKQADAGTLFLDEVSEIPLATQVKLLRFLQERTFERVGGNETVRVDVRIISATNQSLLSCVQRGAFREDLYYRLNVVSLRVPALRERASDIGLLAANFLGRFARESGKQIDGLSNEALARLSGYGWPGNVRELENVVERAVVLCDSDRIETRHLPALIAQDGARDAMPAVPGATLYELERWAILSTLQACAGSTSRAAAILGISPRKIQYKLHEYDGDGRSPIRPRKPSATEPVEQVVNGSFEDKET
jgi:DNA-binding NtrC family response regulator